MDTENCPESSPHQMLIVQNSTNTEWFVANEARIYSNTSGTWFVSAKRMPATDTDIPLHMITWTMPKDGPSQSKTITWVKSQTCAFHQSTKNDAVAYVMNLSDILRVELSTLTTSSVGQMNVYTIYLKNEETVRAYSWMMTFVDAWNSGDIYLKWGMRRCERTSPPITPIL